MQSHEEKVQYVANQVKNAKNAGRPVEFVKKSVSHFVPNPHKDPDENLKIDLSPLCELIEIDEKNRTCTAESGITFTDLAKATLEKDLIPYTVSELKTITIGGAISGCSIESMSYKYGGFHDSCLEYEVITGEGEIINCSPKKETEIFDMLHGSYGTLGIISKVKFKLFPAKPYVKLEYRHHNNFKDYWKDLKERCETGDYTFVDSIIHGRNDLVICLGNMVDTAPYVSDYQWLDIFYKSTAEKDEDYMKTHDYFFRYDTECHWLTKTFPPLEWKPVRFAVGKFFLGSTNLITWSNRLRNILKLKKRPEVVVDVFIPSKRFDKFFNWYEFNFNFWPLWIVPYQIDKIYPWVSPKHKKKMGESFMIDCAVYGKMNNDPDVDFSEVLEKKVTELGGIKTLISRNHYDEKTFWDIFNKSAIEKIKNRLDPENVFGGFYERFAPRNYGKSE